jgi:hypothetical protein
MRHWGLLLLGLWAGMVGGCFTGKPLQSTSWLRPVGSAQGLTGPDVVQMDVALLEAAPGDPYLNEDLWTQADDQVVSLEQKALLAANGFRIGQVGGAIPADLQALLASKRSCRDPRRLQQHAGKPTRLPLGPVLPVCRFAMHQEDRSIPVVLEQAECALVVVPSLTAGGRIRLRITPEIQHGQATVAPQPDRDRTLWMLQKQQPTETYAALSWEVTLAPNEYLLVGGYFDRPATLGQQYFLRIGESVANQRLLMIRASRYAPAITEGPSAAPTEERAAVDRAPPLALQAAWTTVRGNKPEGR